MKVMAYADPIVEAGKRISPFFIESVAVGSIVTIAVITAKIVGMLKKSQTNTVRKTAIPVLITLPPTIFHFLS
ncbi:Uncharacterised protein [Streptococcus pneumoniae]|nr:Uncharacterised protein [Streptococcus pneumoniae]CJJ44288.1 Uncharacterised protein [Streptococcus pneumoniae]CJK16218.1 Uncharacterised protein [Streptococcus pneumoniae]